MVIIFCHFSALLGLLGIPHPARARVLEVDRLPGHHLPPGAARPTAAVLHGQGQDHHLRRRHPALKGHAAHHQEAAQLQLCARRLGLRQDPRHCQEVRYPMPKFYGISPRGALIIHCHCPIGYRGNSMELKNLKLSRDEW